MPRVRVPTRRLFLKGSTAAGIAMPAFRGGGFFVTGDDRLRVGLVGCGGRGAGAAIEAAACHPGVVIEAIGDLVPAAVADTSGLLSRRLGDAFRGSNDRWFTGRDACERVCDSGIDVVILSATAGVRPEHVAAAVSRGLHVYAERPLATDLDGLGRVATFGRAAAARGLSFVTSLSLRYDPHVAAAIERVRSLGDRASEIAAVELSGGLFAERCIDAADAALSALGGHDEEWCCRVSPEGFTLRSADGRSIRIAIDPSPARHGRMVARTAAGSVEFVTPQSRRRATAAGLSAAWAALLGSIRLGRPVNDSHEACRAQAAMLSRRAAFARFGVVAEGSVSACLPETA